MMLRVNDEYLDFNDLVEVEKQIKLFEEISSADGDFSYSFEIPKTINNIRILGNPQPDNINKQVYQRIPAILLTDGGEETFKGYLRIERLTNIITCSFFAGNNNWFGLLAGNLRDLDWTEYDVLLNESNISAAIFNTSGVVLPLVDNGVLPYRGNRQLKVEDFTAGIYVKDVFRKVFSSQGIKITGNLLEDPHYQSAITLNSGKSQKEIDARSSFVRTYNSPLPDGTPAWEVVQFTDDINYPYSDGSQNNFDTSTYRYTADVRMTVDVEFQILDEVFSLIVSDTMAIYKNGVLYKAVYASAPEFPAVVRARMRLEPGDYIEGQISVNLIGLPFISNATFRVTPIYLYYTSGETTVPDWTQQQYVSNIIRAFNVIPAYNSANKTLTLDLFENIKQRTAIDISEHISATEVDYVEFVQNYGKNTRLSHQILEADEDFKKLNLKTLPNDVGVIPVDNEFLPDEADGVTLDFTAPITYINPIFGMSMEKTNILDLSETTKVPFTGVTSGTLDRARFAVEDGVFAISDLVRITDSTNPSYNGDWMVFSIGTGWIEMGGLLYQDDATGDVALMDFIYTDSTSVFLLHHVPLYSVSKFSNKSPFTLEATQYETMAPAFFSVINQGLQISSDFIYSMSFAEGDQISLIDQYFKLTERVLNDPVKLYCTCTLPYYLFTQIDFLSPIVVRTEETQNVYYINRITGYKESYFDCVTELIKLP